MDIKNEVESNKDQEIEIEIQRKNFLGEVDNLTIKFVPREWTGVGLTGCQVKT